MKKNKIVLILSCMFVILSLSAVFLLAFDIKTTEDRLLESANVTDVTHLIQTKLKVTPEEFTSSDWTGVGFNDDQWELVKVPFHRIVSIPQFTEGNFAYYRIHIPRTSFKKVWHQNNELFLGLQYVLFSKLDIYINGTFYKSNTPFSTEEFILNIPIDDTKDNLVSIKGYIKAGDSGINHRGKIVVGKGAELNELHRMSYKLDSVYTLIFMLSKGSILFVFILIYFVIKVDNYFEKALLYGFFVMLEELLTGNFLYKYISLNIQVYSFNLVELGLMLFLFLFLADVLKKEYSKEVLLLIVCAFTLPSYIIAMDALNTNYVFNIDHLLRFWNYALMGVLSFYLVHAYKTEKRLFVFIFLSLSITVWSAIFSKHPSLNFKAFGNLFIFVMVAYQTFILLRRQQDKLVAQEKDVAIGRTAAVLAHDVRRPLDQMSLILNRVSSGEASKEFLKIAKQDVEFSLSAVNNQISEMMNYIKDIKVTLVPVSFYNVLSSSIKQVSVIKKDVSISFVYEFNAEVKIMGEESRLGSAISNLIANAFEAIKDIGRRDTGIIKFITNIKADQFVFTIENDGPCIPELYMDEIFKPLASFGKSSGTGLGLAAVLKTVQEHGGKIEAQNINPTGVRFNVYFKSSIEPDDKSLYHFESKSTTFSYELPVKEKKCTDERFLRIFLLDDDRYVYEYFSDLVKSLPLEIELVHASEFNAATEVIKRKRFDLYILDYDLNSDNNGLTFYKQHLSHLKEGVVLHSNRDKETISDLILPLYPKPMSVFDLLGLCEKAHSQTPKILLVEDSKIITVGWKVFHGNHNLQVVSTPEEALSYLEDHTVEICVLDYFFDGSSLNGEELADLIHQRYPGTRIFICSSSEHGSMKYPLLKKNDYDVQKYI